MSNPNAILGWVKSIEPLQSPHETLADGTSKAVPREVVVHFTDDRKARLTPEMPSSDVHLEILEQRWRRGAPAFVEVDSEARIHQLRLPFVTAVAELTATASGEVEVELELSHARHRLNPANDDFGHLLEELRRARENGEPVIVVETPDNHEIIDVVPSPTALPWTRRDETPEDRSAVPSTVDPDQARRLFALVAGTSCDPLLLPSGCIPFLYPDNGCSERAHAMCRLILEAGVTPAKIWIVGTLRPLSSNHPSCEVLWGVHVAPFLEVRLDGGGVQNWVIDPALFPEGPVPEETWIAAQRDPAAAPGRTHHSVFSLFRSVVLTPTSADDRLAQYREALRDRVRRLGRPPYRCP